MGRRQHGEGSVYERGRQGGRGGQWVAVADLGWRGNKRDRREFTGATPKDAMRKREAFLDRRRDGFTMPKGRQPYVSEWLLHWLWNIAKRTVEPTTWESSYRQKVTELICPYFERTPLPELSEEDIEDWHRHLEATVSKRTGRPLSASTIAQAHRIMSRALKVAVTRGKLARNPCSNVTPPQAHRAEARPPLTTEVAQILERCKTWPNGARWVVAIATGIRQGEALALEWPDVTLGPQGYITIRQSAAQVKGERVVKPPKSASSRRVVPLAADAVAALREHRRNQVASLSGLVFTDGKGQPVHPRADYSDWHALLDDLGIRHYRVHDLRHAFGTYLLEQGIDVKVVQVLLGHSSAAFTQQVYQHVGEELRHEAADAMNRVLRGER
jgi:integrase